MKWPRIHLIFLPRKINLFQPQNSVSFFYRTYLYHLIISPFTRSFILLKKKILFLAKYLLYVS